MLIPPVRLGEMFEIVPRQWRARSLAAGKGCCYAGGMPHYQRQRERGRHLQHWRLRASCVLPPHPGVGRPTGQGVTGHRRGDGRGCQCGREAAATAEDRGGHDHDGNNGSAVPPHRSSSPTGMRGDSGAPRTSKAAVGRQSNSDGGCGPHRRRRPGACGRAPREHSGDAFPAYGPLSIYPPPP